MGGGDLNSKKSWHPNTMKNQERVWKAEQAAAEEKKRIAQLQSERVQEKTRDELNDLAKRTSGVTSNDDRLHWMYNKPEKSVQQEDYLLGKAIEKSYDQPEKTDDVIPAVARRVVGSSMLTSTGDTQVDLARKIREDPLLLVKERERAARAALLNNPLHRRRITELLKKEQMQKKLNESKRKKKKNLDSLLAAKLNALGGDEGIDLTALLASGDSSSDSEKSKKKKKKSKKEKKTKKKKKKHSDQFSESERDLSSRNKPKHRTRSSSLESVNNTITSKDLKRQKAKQKRLSTSESENERSKHLKSSKSKHRSRSRDSETEQVGEAYKNKERNRNDNEVDRKRRNLSNEKESRRERSVSPNQYKRFKDDGKESRRDIRKNISPKRYNRNKSVEEERSSRKVRLSDEDKAARLAAMAAAGLAREEERGRRVAAQRRDDEKAGREGHVPRVAPAPSLPQSLEARIHSNRHYIQRDRRHMDEHFARR